VAANVERGLGPALLIDGRDFQTTPTRRRTTASISGRTCAQATASAVSTTTPSLSSWTWQSWSHLV